MLDLASCYGVEEKRDEEESLRSHLLSAYSGIRAGERGTLVYQFQKALTPALSVEGFKNLRLRLR